MLPAGALQTALLSPSAALPSPAREAALPPSPSALLPAHAPGSSTAPLLAGFLTKQGQHRHSWKRRWFVLHSTHLLYYKRRGTEQLQGAVPLAAVREVMRDMRTYPEPFCFQVQTARRTYAFQADDAEVRPRCLWCRVARRD